MKKRAVFTLVRNERYFLPIWLNYYKKFFSTEDIYVLDHDTTDGSTEELDCNVRRLSHETVSHGWMRQVVRAFQRELLLEYQYVLFAECDEIVISRKGLDCFIDECRVDAVRCTGYNLAQQQEEAQYHPSKTVLSQRGFWFHCKPCCKTLLAKVPLNWRMGFHHAAGIRLHCHDDLILLHLKRLDHTIALERFAERKAMLWDAADVARGLGSHWLSKEMPFWVKGEPIPDDIRMLDVV